MPSTNRRSVLQAAAAGIAGISGCSTLTEDLEPVTPRLLELSVESYHTEPHTFHVRLKLDGETVYEDEERVDAANPEDATGARFTGYPEDAKPYVLSVWMDGDESTARTLDFASIDEECLVVRTFYGSYKQPPEDAQLEIWTHNNCTVAQ